MIATRTKLQQKPKDLLFCAACAKPIKGEMVRVDNKMNPTDKSVFHVDAQACADAPHLRIEWTRKERA